MNWNEAVLMANHGGGRSSCPECGGGASRELCFTVYQRDEDQSWWGKCHRAGCGACKPLVGFFESDNAPEDKPDRRYYGSFTTVPDTVREWCLAKWPGLVRNDFEYHIKWNPGRHTLLMPICNALGKRVGWVEKCASENWGEGCPLASQASLNWPNKVKTWHDDSDDKDSMAWYGPRTDTYAVLVEDQLSALTFSGVRNRQTVALLGTGFNARRMSELQQAGITRLIIALDADATAHAFKMSQKWGLAFTSCKVSILPKDFKDFTIDELEDWIL